MWGGGGMSVSSDVMSGYNRRRKWCPDAGNPEDRKMTSDVSGHGARASDPRLIFTNVDTPTFTPLFSSM